LSRKRQSRLLGHLEQVARPRHSRWDPLGLMAVRSYITDQLSALGPLQKHAFSEGADEGINRILPSLRSA
jgi:hypothetical protein